MTVVLVGGSVEEKHDDSRGGTKHAKLTAALGAPPASTTPPETQTITRTYENEVIAECDGFDVVRNSTWSVIRRIGRFTGSLTLVRFAHKGGQLRETRNPPEDLRDGDEPGERQTRIRSGSTTPRRSSPTTPRSSRASCRRSPRQVAVPSPCSRAWTRTVSYTAGSTSSAKRCLRGVAAPFDGVRGDHFKALTPESDGTIDRKEKAMKVRFLTSGTRMVMKRLLTLVFLAFAGLGVMPASASAQVEHGAIVDDVGCRVLLPGTSERIVIQGQVVITPSGNVTVFCHGEAPQGPPQALIEERTCRGPQGEGSGMVVWTPSGRLHAVCHIHPSP